jgi:hypothetical protein
VLAWSLRTSAPERRHASGGSLVTRCRVRAAPPARRSREATADDKQSRSTYLLNAAPHVLIVSIMIIIWSVEHVCVGAIFDSAALIGAIA